MVLNWLHEQRRGDNTMTLYMVKMGIEHVTLNACGSNGTEHRCQQLLKQTTKKVPETWLVIS